MKSLAAAICLAGTLVGTAAIAAPADICAGITADEVRDVEARFPRTMNGVPAMPVAVSGLYVSSLNGEPKCATHMIVTFGGDIGYDYVFFIERRSDRLHLEPVYGAGLRNPPPIRLYR